MALEFRNWRWKNTKGTIFIKCTIDLQFETDSTGNCPTECKLGRMVVGGAWDVFERVVNLPNPKSETTPILVEQHTKLKAA